MHSEVLQRLAGVRDEPGTAISVYLDLDPSVSPTVPDVEARINALMDEVRRHRPRHAEGDLELRFDEAADRVGAYLEQESGNQTGDRMLALAAFATPDGTFHGERMPRSVADQAVVSTIFSLRALAAAAARSHDLLLLIASREAGRLILVRDGTLHDVFDDSEEIENRHSKGGWAQSKLQRWVDNAAEHHLAEVVEHLERVHARLGRPPILVSATDENAAAVERLLGQEAQAALAGRRSFDGDTPVGELLDVAQEQLDAVDDRREAELLERRDAQLGRSEQDGPGLADVLAMLSDARVEWLLVSPGADPDVYRCHACGRLGDKLGPCPVDDEPMRVEPRGVETAVATALLNGGQVWETRDVHPSLDAAGGLGVVVRF